MPKSCALEKSDEKKQAESDSYEALETQVKGDDEIESSEEAFDLINVKLLGPDGYIDVWQLYITQLRTSTYEYKSSRLRHIDNTIQDLDTWITQFKTKTHV